jgi:hypothetical protein
MDRGPDAERQKGKIKKKKKKNGFCETCRYIVLLHTVTSCLVFSIVSSDTPLPLPSFCSRQNFKITVEPKLNFRDNFGIESHY